MFHGLKLYAWVLSFSLFLASMTVEAKMENSIRVYLGTFFSPPIKAFDLKINGKRSFWDGLWKQKIRCKGAKEGSFIYMGKKRYDSPIQLEGSSLHVKRKEYRGSIYIYEKNNRCMLVNFLSMEEYLRGVVGEEMQRNWPLEALKAQAIAARSYALYRKKEFFHPHYDVFSTVKDQVYGGKSSESRKVEKAVKETHGIVLSFQNKLFKSFYHSNCGGHTKVPLDVWGYREPGYQSVSCPLHSIFPKKKEWVHRTNLYKIESRLRKNAILPKDFLRLAQVSQEKGKKGILLLSDTSGKKFRVPSSRFRSSVGFDQIKSTKFAIYRQGKEKVAFHGRGHGHAVGMCQYGARAMALQHYSYKAILKHYYPLASLRRAY